MIIQSAVVLEAVKARPGNVGVRLDGAATADPDSFCARRRPKSTVGAEESLRRGRTKERRCSKKARKNALAFMAAIRERKDGGDRTEGFASGSAYAPSIFLEGAVIAAAGGFAAIGVAIGTSVSRAREAKDVTTSGSARWATRNEVRAAGLLNPDGVVLGRFVRDYLRHDGPEHVLCFAPTRSGKGVGLVVPTLLIWPDPRSSTTLKVRTGSSQQAFARGSARVVAVRSDQCGIRRIQSAA